MRTLAITTSTLRCGVALLDGATVIAHRAVDDDRLHAERIFSMIDEVLAEAAWSKRELSLVACDIGPGSFTGVRVGLASAKGIALGLRIPIVGIGSLEAMAHAARRHVDDVPILAVLDARRDERFVAVSVLGGELVPPTHVPTARLPELAMEFGPSARWCGDAGGTLDEARRVLGHGCELPDAGVVGRAGLDLVARRGPDALADLEPRYVRPPDAKLPAAAPDRRLAR
jgi:tRNA threonylcarbamoyladenosine biosynthesis protein TsaB